MLEETLLQYLRWGGIFRALPSKHSSEVIFFCQQLFAQCEQGAETGKRGVLVATKRRFISLTDDGGGHTCAVLDPYS